MLMRWSMHNVISRWQDRDDSEHKFKGQVEMTLAEAAAVMGVNKQRAQYLESRALYKLWDGVWSDPELLRMFEETLK